MTDPFNSRIKDTIAMEYQTEISVDGKATVVAIPDTISLLIRVGSKATDYTEAVQRLNEGASAVAQTLASCGVVDKPQTREYAVNEEWADRFDDAKRRLIGYEGVQQLVVDFPIDMKVLGGVLQGLGAIATRPTVDTYFQVKDQTGILQQARQAALYAATATAHDMAAQMGLKIVGVKSVKHSMSRDASPHSLHVAFEGDSMSKMSYSLPDIAPEEVSNMANVSVIWFAIN